MCTAWGCTNSLFRPQLQRNILATCPRVTRFKIDWGDSGGASGSNENQPPVTEEGDMETSRQQAHCENSSDIPLKNLMNRDNSGMRDDSNSLDMPLVLNEKSHSNGLSNQDEAMQL